MIRAISIRQPWAQLIADNIKPIETRMWTTRHRGPLLICASKTLDLDASRVWDLIDERTLPRGQAIATCNLVDCRLMRKEDEARACCPFRPRAYAWILEDIRKIKTFLVEGTLGLFWVRDEDWTIAHE